MSKINMHNLPLRGIRKASGNTINYTDPAKYDEIFYNRRTGEVWTVYQYDLAHNWWTEYHDPDIIKIGETSRHLTMQEIADLIYEKMNVK